MTGAEAVILIIIIVGFVIYQVVHHSTQSTLLTDDTQLPRSSHADHERIINQLQQRDANFDFSHFADRVENAFRQIQDAWQDQDLKPVYPFISDSILERFSIQIDEQKRAGYRDQISDLDVHRNSLRLASLTSTPHFETLDVCITATAVDYRVSLETGKPVDGKSGAETFTEYWSFLRRSDVTTRRDQNGLIEGNCPNCGAALELNQIGACTSCQAVLRSGAHDWVLAEITQACEWKPTLNQPDAFTVFRDTKDPGFSVQHIEDRASVIFWRKTLADRTGDVAPLRKMATDEFCQAYAAELSKAQTPSGRRFWHDCAVGSVACLGIVSEEQADHILLEVRWAGNRFTVKPDGSLADLDSWKRMRSLFVLMRQHGVKSRLEHTITSSHCPACGAPESDLTSDTCSYCNQVVNDGRHDWVLYDLTTRHSEIGKRWLQKVAKTVSRPATTSTGATITAAASAKLPQASQFEALAWVIQAAVADHTVTEQEKRVLEQLARRQGAHPKRVEAMIELARAGELELPTPSDRDTARNWLTIVADVVVADGQIDEAEQQLLLDLGQHLDLGDYDIKLLLAKRQAQRRTL